MAPATPMTMNPQMASQGRTISPDAMARQRFYRPIERGFEREIVKRLAWWEKLRKKQGQSP